MDIAGGGTQARQFALKAISAALLGQRGNRAEAPRCRVELDAERADLHAGWRVEFDSTSLACREAVAIRQNEGCMGHPGHRDRTRKHRPAGVISNDDAHVTSLRTGIGERDSCHEPAGIVKTKEVCRSVARFQRHYRLVVKGRRG